MLYIFNKEEKLKAVLENDTASSFPYLYAKVKEQLNGIETLEFEIPAKNEGAKYVKEGNYVGIRITRDRYKLFEIKEAQENHGDKVTKSFFAETAVLELSEDIIEDKRPSDVQAHFALQKALENTRWEVGDYELGQLESASFYYTNVMAALEEIVRIWGCELSFHVEVVDNKIIKRCVNIHQRLGNDLGKRFEYKKDISSIQRTVDISNLYTSVIPRGKGVELEDEEGNGTGTYGRRLTIEDTEWKTPTNPVDKPLGQEYLEDPVAKELYGRINSDGSKRNKTYVLELSNETEGNSLIELAWQDLQTKNFPIIQYELDVIDLSQLIGHDHEKISIGDTVKVIDTEFNPPLRVITRIIELEKELGYPEKTVVKLGNFLPNLASENKLYNIEKTITSIQSTIPKDPVIFKGYETSYLKGALDVANNELISTGGYVQITDTDGILILDKPTKEESTRAIRLKAGILAISDEKDVGGNFVFRTFGTGSGFTADEITTGRIRADLVEISSATTFAPGYNPQDKLSLDNLNIVKNGDFSIGKYGWGVDAGGYGEKVDNAPLQANPKVNIVKGVGENGEDVLESADNLFIYGDQLIRIVEGKSYKASVKVKLTKGPDPGKYNHFYSGFALYDKDHKKLSGNLKYFLTAANSLTLNQWLTFENEIGTSSNPFPEGAYYARPLLVTNNGGGNGITQVSNFRVWIEEDTNLTNILATETAGSLVLTNQEGFIDVATYALRQSSNFFWDNSGFFAIDPNNSENIVRINSGGIGISTNGGQSFQTAMTADGVVADVITAGTMMFDRLSGGTLTLGGIDNQHGVMRLEDGNGDEVATLSGDKGGFSVLSVDRLENTQNVVSMTSNVEKYFQNGSWQIWVDKLRAEKLTEISDGTREKPFASIREAISIIPRYLDDHVYVNIAPQRYLERVNILGFTGHGKILLRSYIPNIRYVRVWSNGSNLNYTNHLSEIEVWKYGVGSLRTNLASASWVASSTTLTNEEHLRIKNGNKTANDFSIIGDGVQWYLLDLRSNYDISGVNVWRYWNDGRTYKDTKIEVSEDKVNWYPLQDSTIDGEYQETSAGYDASHFHVQGGIHTHSSNYVDIYGAWLQPALDDKEGDSCLYCYNSTVMAQECVVHGEGRIKYPVQTSENGWMRLRFSEVNGGTTSNIGSTYMSRMEVHNCTGGDSPCGITSHGGSIITGEGTCPRGDSSPTQIFNYGQIWGNFTPTPGPNTALPPLINKTVKQTFKSTWAGAWDLSRGIWHQTAQPIQGKWESWGNYRGYWFWGNVFTFLQSANVVSIDKMRIYVQRTSTSGYALDTTVRLRPHAYTTKPAGTPVIETNDIATVVLDRGQGTWVTLPKSMRDKFKAGTAKGIGVYTDTNLEREYCKLSGSATLEITYTVQESEW